MRRIWGLRSRSRGHGRAYERSQHNSRYDSGFHLTLLIEFWQRKTSLAVTGITCSGDNPSKLSTYFLEMLATF